MLMGLPVPTWWASMVCGSLPSVGAIARSWPAETRRAPLPDFVAGLAASRHGPPETAALRAERNRVNV
jgi:hypothetical protein